MIKQGLSLALAGAVLLCGCDRQTRLNTEKISALAQQLVVLQQVQSRQLATLQSQLAALAPMVDKINGSYFEKAHREEFFFHTNTLYLILLVDNKIESELRDAAAARSADTALAYAYHTNETAAIQLCAAQIRDALAGQEGRLEANVNAETARTAAALGDELAKQIRLAAPDAAETVRRRQLASDVAQIRRDLEALNARLAMTNPPASGP